MQQNIRVDFVALPGALGKRAAAFNISFTYPDPIKAQRTVAALVTAFQDASWQRNQALQPPDKGEVMDVLDTPNLPMGPLMPNRRMMAGTGCVAGLLIAAIFALFRRGRPASTFPVVNPTA